MNTILKTALVVLAFLLTGCATQASRSSGSTRFGLERRADFGPAYTPFAEFSHNEERRDGQLVNYSISGRDIILADIPKVEAYLEKYRSKCQYGVKQEYRRGGEYRNPAVSSTYYPPHATAAAIWGVVEQPKLFSIDVRFECNPAPSKK